MSEATGYRLLKAHDLIASPAYVMIKAADRFYTQARRLNEMWQTDFTYFKIIGSGWVSNSASVTRAGGGYRLRTSARTDSTSAAPAHDICRCRARKADPGRCAAIANTEYTSSPAAGSPSTTSENIGMDYWVWADPFRRFIRPAPRPPHPCDKTFWRQIDASPPRQTIGSSPQILVWRGRCYGRNVCRPGGDFLRAQVSVARKNSDISASRLTFGKKAPFI